MKFFVVIKHAKLDSICEPFTLSVWKAIHQYFCIAFPFFCILNATSRDRSSLITLLKIVSSFHPYCYTLIPFYFLHHNYHYLKLFVYFLSPYLRCQLHEGKRLVLFTVIYTQHYSII